MSLSTYSVNSQNCIASVPNISASSYTPCANQIVTLSCSGGALVTPLIGQQWSWAYYSSSFCSSTNYNNFLGWFGPSNANINALNGTTLSITQPTTYVAITAQNGACGTNIPCGAMLTIVRTNGPAIMLSTGPRYFCPGTAANITATVTGAPISYTWTKNGTSIPGASTTVLSFTNPTLADAGTYNLKATNACGTTTSSAVTFTVLGNQNIGGISNALINTTTGHSVPNLSSQGISYSWSLLNGGTITNGATSNSTSVSWGSTIGIYTLTLNKTLGACSVADTKTISLEQCNINPITFLVSNTGTVCKGTSVTLTAIGGSGTYTWSNGNNGPSYQYTANATTTHSLTLIDLLSCVRTGSIVVPVSQGPQLTLSASSSVICVGETATLNVSGASTYNWIGENNTTNSLVITPAYSGPYVVSGKDEAGCENFTTLNMVVSACTGLIENGKNRFAVYPNPADDHIYVETPNASYYEVSDLLGKIHLKGSLSSDKNGIEISMLKNGAYYIRIIDREKESVRRFIKL